MMDYFSWSQVVTTGSISFETYCIQLYVKNFTADPIRPFGLQTPFLLAASTNLLMKISVSKKS